MLVIQRPKQWILIRYLSILLLNFCNTADGSITLRDNTAAKSKRQEPSTERADRITASYAYGPFWFNPIETKYVLIRNQDGIWKPKHYLPEPNGFSDPCSGYAAEIHAATCEGWRNKYWKREMLARTLQRSTHSWTDMRNSTHNKQAQFVYV